jgi:hypothetical protein
MSSDLQRLGTFGIVPLLVLPYGGTGCRSASCFPLLVSEMPQSIGFGCEPFPGTTHSSFPSSDPIPPRLHGNHQEMPQLIGFGSQQALGGGDKGRKLYVPFTVITAMTAIMRVAIAAIQASMAMML